MRILFFLFLSILVSSCSSVGQIKPTQREINNSFSSESDYNLIWSAVQQWILAENIPISRVDRDGGFVYAEYSPTDAFGVMDCGRVEGRMGFSSARIQGLNVKLSLMFIKVDNKVEISINVFGEATAAIRDLMTDSQLSGSMKLICFSTGKLESKLEQHLMTSKII